MNNNEIIKALKKAEFGLNITDLTNKTNLSRGQIRTSLAYLLGAKRVIERGTPNYKLYFLVEDKLDKVKK